MPNTTKIRKTIILRDQKLMLRIGVEPHEKKKRQRVLVSAEVEIQNKEENDSLEHTFDYQKLHTFIKNLEDEPHRELQETLARRICSFIFSVEKDILRAKIEISKPKAFKDCSFAGVCLEVFREDSRDCRKADVAK